MRTLFLLILVFLLSCSQKEHDKRNVNEDYCHGKIVGTEYRHFLIRIDFFKSRKCFVWNEYMPYSVEQKERKIRYKLMPPFRTVTYKSLKMTWAPKVFPSSSPFYMEGNDSLYLPWRSDLNLFNDSVFWKEYGFASFKNIYKGDSLILEIPCVDEDYVKKFPVFQIGQTKVPVIECRIDPVDRDYPVYLDSMDIW